MTINNANNKNQFTANGINDTFTYTFKIFKQSEIVVDVDGVPQVITTDYTVTGVGNAGGGDVVFTGGSIPANLAIVTLQLSPDFTQEIAYVEGDDFPSASHEEGLDRSTQRDLNLSEEISRTLQVPLNTVTTFDSTLPTPSAGLGIKWNATEDAMINTTFDPDTQATAAAASAAAAASSETAAASSASSAATSASDAATSAALVPLARFDATTDPTTGDDSDDGYGVGSTWVNVTSNVAFVCVDPTVGAAIWKILSAQNAINVKDHGAIGDGVADDTAAVAAALVAGDVIYFPPGTYKKDATILGNNQTVMGSASSIFTLNGIATIGFNITGTNVLVEGVAFDYSNVTDSTAINDSGCNNLIVSTCHFKDCAISMHINSSGKNIRFTDNQIVGGGYGVLVNDSASGESLLVNDNIFDGEFDAVNNRDAVEINLPTGVFPYITISTNIMRNYNSGTTTSGFGVGVAGGRHVSITGNVIDNCGFQGIHLEDDSRFITVTGNTVSNCGVGANTPVNQGHGISVIETFHSVFSGNTCFANEDTGLFFSGVTLSRHIIVSNNSCMENGDDGIFISSPRFFNVHGNICKNNADAGIEMTSPSRSLFYGNICHNEANPAAPLQSQEFGINVTGAATNSAFFMNQCFDNNTADFAGLGSSSTLIEAFDGIMDNTVQAATRTYTPSNVVIDRTYDANSTTTAELADVLGTLIADLQEKGVLS